MSPSRLLADFAAATAFLTRIPAPRPVGHAGSLADAVWAFPLVGAGIGAVAALVFLLAQLVREKSPALVLLAGTAQGKEVAGRLAVKIDSGVLTDAVDLQPGDDGPVAEQSIFGGATIVHSRVKRGTPIVAMRPMSQITVRWVSRLVVTMRRLRPLACSAATAVSMSWST